MVALLVLMVLGLAGAFIWSRFGKSAKAKVEAEAGVEEGKIASELKSKIDSKLKI